MELSNSTPGVFSFKPVIPYQRILINNIRKKFDYSLGLHEVLLSGAVGSAKSTVAAHLIVTHCMDNDGARVALCRRSLPDIKRTIFGKCLEHIANDLIEGEDYWVNNTQGIIKFRNGSEIISVSWADKRYMKVRSLDLSAACVEEIVESSGDDLQAYTEIKMRVGRLPHIKEKWIISCTNPSNPSSFWYKYFFIDKKPTRHVMLSRTEDNPFLPDSYVRQLRQDLDPKMAMRMLDGLWIEIGQEVIYYAYNSEKQYLKTPYTVNEYAPITLSFDFNIGVGKPMSSCAYQHIGDQFHVFKQVVVHGARTLDIMEEYFNAGMFKPGRRIIIHGDATGKARHTNSIHSDYDIITNYLRNINGITYEMQVPLANPPIRSRHNRVNAYCMNALGKTRLWIYEGCDKVDEALRLTQFKKGADLVEDDTKDYQHIGTALGYGIFYDTNQTPGLQYSSSKR